MTPPLSRRDFLRLGFAALSPMGLNWLRRAASDPTAEPWWGDEFSNSTLDPVWSWVREDPTHWSLTTHPGYLRIITQGGGMVGATGDQQNLLLANAPGEEYQITTRVTINPTQNFQHAAILVYEDDDNYVQLNRAFANGDAVNFDHEADGVVKSTQRNETASVLYLRVAKRRTSYAGTYSLDGQAWLTVGRCQASLASPRIGVGAANRLYDTAEIPGDFDFFALTPPDSHIFLPAVARSYRPTDLLLVNGTVLTMDESQPAAQAIAIRDQCVTTVATEAEILALQGSQAGVIDLGGATLMPGFVDPHTHLLQEALTNGIESPQQAALEHGITTLGAAYTDPQLLKMMQTFHQAGDLQVRTSAYLVYADACGVVQGDWYREHPPTRAWGEMLRIGGVKVFADGSACGAPAVRYDHPTHGHGDLRFTQDEMNTIISAIHEVGYQAAIHALGDRAVDQVLNPIGHVLDGGANARRNRIEHNAVVRDDLLALYPQVDPIALIFGSYPACAPLVTPPPVEGQPWEWRWPDLLAANPSGHFAWHSDRGAALFPLPPLMHLFSMVTPYEVDIDGETICDTPDWLAHKMLTVADVLPMMTIEAAYALDRDGEVGSLRAGKLADLVVLSDNPLGVSPTAIKDLEVHMTMAGGRVAHRKSGFEDLCPAR